MTTYLPTLKQLQHLVALKEQGHFGRAADACFVTQSTLSAGVREPSPREADFRLLAETLAALRRGD